MKDYKQELKKELEQYWDLAYPQWKGAHIGLLVDWIATKLEEVEAKTRAEERLKYEMQQSITTGDGTGLTLDNLEKGLAKR